MFVRVSRAALMIEVQPSIWRSGKLARSSLEH
jgi:hypothetical protein